MSPTNSSKVATLSMTLDASILFPPTSNLMTVLMIGISKASAFIPLGISNLDGYRNTTHKDKTLKKRLKTAYETKNTKHEALLKKLTG
jgi:hypothetical protein